MTAGGGIYINANETIDQSSVQGNEVLGIGSSSGGGGIYNNVGLTLTASTINGNSALGNGAGGGLYNADTVFATNSTITGNDSKTNGGGIANASEERLTNVTLYQNTAVKGGGNLYNNPGLTELLNTIAGGGTAPTGPDIDDIGGTLVSNDYNIIQTGVAGNPITGTVTHDKTANPQLIALSSNGGPTFTNADLATSSGKDYIPFAGGNCGNATGLTVDQRGYKRGGDGKCDVGAYEFAATPSLIHMRVQPVRGTGRHRQVHPRPWWLQSADKGTIRR